MDVVDRLEILFSAEGFIWSGLLPALLPNYYMARNNIFCAACQKLHGRKLAQKHERLLNAQPYPPQPILRRVGVTSRHGPAPDSDPIPEPVAQRGHDDEVPNNFMDNDMGAGTPPSSPQHSQRLPHGCFMVEEVDEDDEEEPDLEDVGMDDNDEDEFHFVNFDWDGLERDTDGLTTMDRSSAAYHQRVSEISTSLFFKQCTIPNASYS